MYTVWVGERIETATFILATASDDDANYEAQRLLRHGHRHVIIRNPNCAMPPFCPYTLRVRDALGVEQLRRDYDDRYRALDDADCFKSGHVTVTRYDGKVKYDEHKAGAAT